jgi:predicted naringenin-chalcone synthase
MVWTIGDHGFQLHLSPRIPDHIAESAPQCLAALFGKVRPHFWAIHPGGRGILDRLAEIFDLEQHEAKPSREVLRRAGNLSSATVLFVLNEIRHHLARANDPQSSPQGVAMAFGPGLVVEMARLTYVAEASHLQPVAVEEAAALSR